MPGGHLEYGETLIECAKRELKEELGIEGLEFKLVAMTDNIDDRGHYVHASFLVEKFLGEIQNMEPDLCFEWQFFNISGLPEDIFKPHKRILKTYLAKRNITLVVVLNPTKSTIYPEYLEPGVITNVRPRLLQRLREDLSHEPGLIFIDSEILLREHKNETLFYKTDLHLGPRGSFYVYNEMVKKIALAS